MHISAALVTVSMRAAPAGTVVTDSPWPDGIGEVPEQHTFLVGTLRIQTPRRILQAFFQTGDERVVREVHL